MRITRKGSHASERDPIGPPPNISGLRARVGDQPLPIVNGHPAIQDLVVSDMAARKALGIQRYGTALQPFNGRDALRDLYEELLDGCNYIRQLLYERDGS